MAGLKDRIYAAAPPFMRSWMASAYGYYARQARYDRDTDRLVAEAFERETWTSDAWQAWQGERLREVLDAARRTPHYHAELSATNSDPWDELARMPLLEKEALRRNPDAFISDSADKSRLHRIQTSGTTGTPLTLWHSRETNKRWYALFEARCRRWYGVNNDMPWAILGGKLVKPVGETKPPYWVWNAPMRQLYMSTYHLSPVRIGEYLDALKQHGARYVLAYTSALYELAIGALERGRRDIRFDVAITNAEPVFPYQRRAIEEAFGCPVRETYGASEQSVGASECSAGRLHLWPDAGIVEILDEDGQIQCDGAGEILVTSLLKLEMPLIRYRIGDCGASVLRDDLCSCGRRLPWLKRIDGRADDVLVTPRGERVGRLDPVFKADLPIREAQIVQEALDRILVRLVPADGFSEAHERQLTEALRARLGDVQVRFEKVAQVPRTKSGKFRAVISLIAGQQNPPHVTVAPGKHV